MSLETPNSLAASIMFSFAEASALPPGLDNDFLLDITGIQGVIAMQPVVDGTLVSGFLLDLQDKITPDIGSYQINGFDPLSCTRVGFTPIAQLTGVAAVDDLANEADGNFLVADPDLGFGYGEVGISLWTNTPTEEVIPFNLPAPA